METKISTKYGSFFHFDGRAYCPRCSNIIPPDKIACIGCIPGANEAPKKRKRNKPKPDQDGLFAGVPGVRV